jgi:membrane protease YdiL (CAAX protease family)
VAYLAYLIWPAVCFQLLILSGFYDRFYPSDIVEAFRDAASPEHATARTRLLLWAMVAAFPLQALTIPLLLAHLHGIRPGQLGLTARRWGANLGRGFLLWLLLSPVVWTLNWAVATLYDRWLPGGPEEMSQRLHPFHRLSKQGLFPSEWFLLVFAAVVVAPVLEELLFRGVIQSWCARAAWCSHAALALAGAFALTSHQDQLVRAWQGDGEGLVQAGAPGLFILALVPLYVWACCRGNPKFPAPVFATSALFAAIHSFAWPSPVALFVLALGLGQLARRTGSLAGPILCHSLFNAVSCLILLWG